jgi:hypothetical protein
MGIFAKLNFARSVILLSFLGSAVLGWFVWQQRQELQELERTLNRAPERLQRLQAQALQVADLERQAASEGLGRQSDPETYIRSIATDREVKVGQVETDPRERTGSGYRDMIMDISPNKGAGQQSFALWQIANFMYLLESRSRRVRVTEVEIEPVGTRGRREHEVLSGEWTFDISMTTREKVEN